MKLNKEKIKQLKELLNEWFDNMNLAGPNVFNQNEIAKLIKKKLNKIGHWKGKPRGNKNNLDNLNKGKLNKEKLIEIKKLLVCPCGKDLIVCDKKLNQLECSDYFCQEYLKLKLLTGQ